ncbi:MAG: hypothetical protein PHW95_01935 [Patescibacteria group bacterium]|nr:hypothetical protein [Patescibacteria group bacterium]
MKLSLTTKKITIGAVLMFIGSATNASASILQKAKSGLQTTINEAYGGGNNITVGTNAFTGSLFKILGSLLTFLGVIFFLLLIYAGYTWMMARGNEEHIEKAKKMTREVVIGLIIILMARIITEFVLTQFSGAIKQ